MREQWCREHIDIVAKNCHLSEKQTREIKTAAKFCLEHPPFTDCATTTILAVLSAKGKGEKVIKGVIDEAERILRQRKPNGDWVKRKLTEKEVIKLISKYQILYPQKESKPRKKPVIKQQSQKIDNSSKSRMLVVDVLEKEDVQILKNIIALEYAEDEYSAMRVAFKWAGERIAGGLKTEVR